MKLLLENARLIDPAVGLDGPGSVLIEDGRIVRVASDIDAAALSGDVRVIDLSGKILVPGLVDAHVHFREPGFEYKETIRTGARAAVHGGFTGVCTMPNTNPETDTAEAIDFVLSRAAEAGMCHVYPSGSCTTGRAGEALSEMGDMVAHGAVAFTDDGRGVQDAGMMRRVMDYEKMFGKVIMSHCQDEALVGKGQVNEGVVSTRLGLLGWPSAGEEIQIARDIALSELTGCPIHIQHITSVRGVELVREGKQRGIQVTCEVTPNHLFLTEDKITEAYETNFKINPPLRTAADRDALVNALADGTIDCIVTDHAPHADFEKEREFELAPFGMVGLETSLATVLTYLVRPGIIGYDRLVEAMSIAPRRILRLEPVRLEEGSAADLTAFDPEAVWTVDAANFESKGVNSGFLGSELIGKATDVFVAGKPVMEEGEIVE